MKKRLFAINAVSCLVLGLASLARLEAQNVQVRPKVSEALPHYQARTQVGGSLEIPCTDVLIDLGDEWSRAFRERQPEAKLVFVPKVTKDGLVTLMAGTAPLIIVSRELTPEEMKAFAAKFGYTPLRIPLCMDANIVFVNKANPITYITMEQLDAIYSRNRLGGASASAVVWGDLGVKGELAKRTINAYSRGEGTGTRSSFATMALLGGPFRSGILEREDPTALAEAVSTDAAGIAYGPMSSGFETNKTLPVVPYHGTEARFPTQEMVTTTRYPMPRIFYAYLNRAPGKPLDPLIGEVLRFMLAQEGQRGVANVGLLPGPVEFMASALKRLDH